MLDFERRKFDAGNMRAQTVVCLPEGCPFPWLAVLLILKNVSLMNVLPISVKAV